ncbi:MAG TPA: HAMP domain-containing sensor histidine kinase [Longimicrobiales bacterium]|nr:HAMP domain-containing sensor histidine kinase [Longimicrobiales bacterium]
MPVPSHPNGSGTGEGTDTLAVIRELAGPALADAVRRFMEDVPSDLAEHKLTDLEQHLLWLARAAGRGASPGPIEGSGVGIVLRRRILDALRSNLILAWTADPPSSADMLDMLSRLEHARELCVPTADQGFTAELSDVGGLDLLIEVAHDMRSPLTSVLFLSEVLHKGQSGPLNDVQKRQIGIVYSAALGLVGMASDMIEIARGGDRLASRKPEPFSVSHMLQSVNDLVGPTAEEKGLEVRIVQLASERRLGYPIPLSRVLLNLTSNALKFTHQGSVEVSARPVGGNRVEFSVTDTGSGIAPEAMDTLYQPFRREPRRESGYYFSGTGLGLAICRRLVTALESELVLVTGPEGTRFSFELELPPAHLI